MISLYVENTNELIRDLRKAKADVRKEAYSVIKEQAEKIKYDAQGKVPIGATMALLASIKSSASKKTLTGSVSAGGQVGGNDAYYALFVEFGTHKMPAQPFLYPSGRAHEQETEERLTAVMYEALRKGVEGVSHLTAAQAVYTALTGNTALMAKITGVYDVVPEGTAGPYIALGYQQSLRGRIINETERVWYYDLDIWSEYQGRKEILEIADLVRAALPSEWFYEELTVLKDPSGWYHGVLTIKGYDR